MGMPMAGGDADDGRRAGRDHVHGVDESLSQVQAALAGSGAAAASPYGNAAQGNYSVEQLREYLRQSGLPAEATIDKLTDTGQIVGDERLYTMAVTLHIPGQPPQTAGRVRGDGPAHGDAQGPRRRQGAGQVRRRQPEPGDVRVGQDLFR